MVRFGGLVVPCTRLRRPSRVAGGDPPGPAKLCGDPGLIAGGAGTWAAARVPSLVSTLSASQSAEPLVTLQRSLPEPLLQGH